MEEDQVNPIRGIIKTLGNLEENVTYTRKLLRLQIKIIQGLMYAEYGDVIARCSDLITARRQIDPGIRLPFVYNEVDTLSFVVRRFARLQLNQEKAIMTRGERGRTKFKGTEDELEYLRARVARLETKLDEFDVDDPEDFEDEEPDSSIHPLQFWGNFPEGSPQRAIGILWQRVDDLVKVLISEEEIPATEHQAALARLRVLHSELPDEKESQADLDSEA